MPGWCSKFYCKSDETIEIPVQEEEWTLFLIRSNYEGRPRIVKGVFWFKKMFEQMFTVWNVFTWSGAISVDFCLPISDTLLSSIWVYSERKSFAPWETNSFLLQDTPFLVCLCMQNDKRKVTRVAFPVQLAQKSTKYSKIPILRLPLGLSKSGLKDHFWTVPKVVFN